MYFSDMCSLVKNIEEKGSYGANKTKEVVRDLFCNKISIGMTESYELNRLGYKGECKLEVMKIDYEEEDEVIYDGKKYKIYRTYERKDDVVELTCIKAI